MSAVVAFRRKDGGFTLEHFAKSFDLYTTDLLFTLAIVVASTILIGLVAIAIAGYLTYERHLGQNAVCPVGGGGCETVAHSSYSKFAGVPVSYFGMLGALTLLALCFRSELLFGTLRFVVTGVGAAFSLYLTSLEATKINTPDGEMSVRAADHQALLPIVVVFWCPMKPSVSAVAPFPKENSPSP